MNKKLRPLREFVFVQPIQESRDSYVKTGPLFIPARAVENSSWERGRIVAKGPGFGHNAEGLNEGDIVMFPKGTGQRFEYKDQVYIALKKQEFYFLEEK